jgi:hypothetical protein
MYFIAEVKDRPLFKAVIFEVDETIWRSTLDMLENINLDAAGKGVAFPVTRAIAYKNVCALVPISNLDLVSIPALVSIPMDDDTPGPPKKKPRGRPRKK